MALLKKIILISVLFVALVATAALAQPGRNPNGGGRPGTTPVPITGIEVLIALGGFLGIKKILDTRKAK